MDIETDKDILAMVERKHSESIQQQQRGLIIQPGAVGDCILTLPLAQILKQTLNLGGVDLLGHMDYTGYFPQRTFVDSVRSLDSLDLHCLFGDPNTFDLDQHDPLISIFSDYQYILSFLGGTDSNFEKNLVYTVHCTHSAEIISLDLTPDDAYDRHITEFYCQQFHEQWSGESTFTMSPPAPIISPDPTDLQRGQHLLTEAQLDSTAPVIVIHPGSGGTQKCWHLDNYLQIAKVLLEQGRQVAFLIGPVEQERWSAEMIKQMQETAPVLVDIGLSDVLAILSCAEAFIGNDSGVSHLAAALGRPTCVLFGPTNPCVYRPLGPKVYTVCDPQESFAQAPSPAHQEQVLQGLSQLQQG